MNYQCHAAAVRRLSHAGLFNNKTPSANEQTIKLLNEYGKTDT